MTTTLRHDPGVNKIGRNSKRSKPNPMELGGSGRALSAPPLRCWKSGGGGLGSQTLLDWLKIGPNPVEKSYIYIFENIPERERGEATLEH